MGHVSMTLTTSSIDYYWRHVQSMDSVFSCCKIEAAAAAAAAGVAADEIDGHR